MARRYRVVVPFGDPLRGRNMVRVANAFIRRNEQADITAIHFSPSSDLNPFNTAARERESFGPIRKEAMKLSMRLDTVFRASNDIHKDVLATINSGGYDLAVVGAGRSIYEGTVLGRMLGIGRRFIDPERLLDTITGKEGLFERAEFEDRVRQILRESRIPVGVYVDKGLEGIAQVAVVLTGSGDSFLLTWAQKVMLNEDAHITFVDLGEVLQQNPELLATIRALQVAAPGKLDIRHAQDSDAEAISGGDLFLISLEGWKRAVEKQSPWLATAPSTLIIRP
jgi:hypothetical protein